MKASAIRCTFLTTLILGTAAILTPGVFVASRPRTRTIAQCPWDGIQFSLTNKTIVFPLEAYGNLQLTARMTHPDGDGAEFAVLRGQQPIFKKYVTDTSNPNGWLAVSDDRRSFAINTSNGGAAGGWSVSILRINDDGTVHDLSSSMKSVVKDFASHHHCAARGENQQAIRWQTNDQLLIVAEVYPTGDCGAEAGFGEGYILEASTGYIIRRLSEHSVLNLPYVRTYNVWQPGDPEPHI